MSYTLEGYFEFFTPDDLFYNCKGQLSNRQYDEMQAELKKYRKTLQRIIAFACGGLALFCLLLIANSGNLVLQILMVGPGIIFIRLSGIAWRFYTRLYRRHNHDIQNGKVGILKRIRPSQFVDFDFTMSHSNETVHMLKYETSNVKLLILDDTFALLDPDTPYNFYYWTSNTRFPEFGNPILSLEPAT